MYSFLNVVILRCVPMSQQWIFSVFEFHLSYFLISLFIISFLLFCFHISIIDCPKLERLPDEIGNLGALSYLRVERAAIREVPENLGQLTSLAKFDS